MQYKNVTIRLKLFFQVNVLDPGTFEFQNEKRISPKVQIYKIQTNSLSFSFFLSPTHTTLRNN